MRGLLDEQAIIAAARRRQRRRRRRIIVALVVLVAVGLAVAGLAIGGWPWSSTAGGGPAALELKWRTAGSTVWYHAGPGNDPVAPAPASLTCAGNGTPTCYAVIHANGIGLNGKPTDPGQDLGDSPDITSLLRSTDGGVQWQRLRLPATTWLSTPPACPSATSCMIGATVAGGSAPAYDHVGTPIVLVTADGGQSWSERRLPPGNGMVTAISCATTSNCVALTVRKDAPVCDGVPIPDCSAANFIFPTNVIVTTDAGQTWTRMNTPANPPNTHDDYWLDSVICPDVSHCYFAGSRTTVVSSGHGTRRTATDDGVVLTSRGSRSGLSTSLSDDLWPGALSCGDPTYCLILGSGNGIGPATAFTTVDAGTIWVPVRVIGVPSGYDLLLVSCVSAQTCLAADNGSSGVADLTVTHDGGKHWTLDPSAGAIEAFSCTAEKKCVALQIEQSGGDRPIRNFGS